MDSESESSKSHTESEEDLGCYFLQPASSPYNITEKVHQANVDLFNSSSYANNEKTAKVKFRDELVSYEPDSTDDDINSIESDHVEIPVDLRPTILEYKTAINADVNIFDIAEECEEYVEEEVVEDIESDCEEGIRLIEHNYKSDLKSDIAPTVEDSSNTITDSSTKRSRKRRKNCFKSTFLNPREVHCKDHCIDRLDFDLSMSIKKLEIHEKVNLPPLQLLQRKCCDQVKQTVHRNLPHYKGFRSEYGLTSRQLEKKEKQAELIKLREQIRHQLLEEYRQRKIQQNEVVFIQWLKEVAKRNSESKKQKRKKVGSPIQGVNTSTKILSNKICRKVPQRPKTAKEFSKKPCGKKLQRPHTTHSCVYIEIPQSVLKEGLSIGDLTITSSKLNSRKLHILTVS